jgi:hypothetical protein
MTTFDLVEAKSEWSLDPEVHHLNHGSYGALPRVVYAEQKNGKKRFIKTLLVFMRAYPVQPLPRLGPRLLNF